MESGIDRMWDEIQRVYEHYGFSAVDWPRIRRESPRLFERIGALENMEPSTLDEVLEIRRALKLNYERAFMRARGGRVHVSGH